MIFLDTHAAVFLWEGRVEVFGTAARRILEAEPLWISPVCRLELQFLHEIGRIREKPDTLLGGLESDCGVQQSDDPIRAIVARAMALTWTRDPFDRAIVATALYHEAPLVTRDRTITAYFPGAVWD